MHSAFDFELPGIDGRPLPLSRWRGQVLLLVNTASRCGFTPQYAGLQRLWQRYRAQGLMVVGCPCNQFGGQEPASDAHILGFCAMEYGVDFPLSAKLQVNGPGAHPLWTWLRAARPGVLGTDAIKWNFTKFLVDRDGQVIDRYAPLTAPGELAGHIEHALAQTAA